MTTGTHDNYFVHIPPNEFAFGEPLFEHFSSTDPTSGPDDPVNNLNEDATTHSDNGDDPVNVGDVVSIGISSLPITLEALGFRTAVRRRE